MIKTFVQRNGGSGWTNVLVNSREGPVGLPFGSLHGMPTTTIKVETGVRDRLAVLARERRTTMGALLAEVTERLEREAFFARAREELLRLRDEDPSAWQIQIEESRAWHDGTDRDAFSLKDEPGWWE